MSNCTQCGTVLNHSLEIATTDSLCPSCSTGSLINLTGNPVGGDGACCVESVNGKTGVVVLTINDIDLLTNNFFTQVQILAMLSASAPISYDNVTGIISHDASSVTPGTYGSAILIPQIVVDAKGHVTSVTDISISIPTIGADLTAIEALTGVGYLIRTAADTWVLRGISGTSGNISVAEPLGTTGPTVLDLVVTAVTPGTYGSATGYPTFTVDAYGRLTAASTTAFPTLSYPSHTHTLGDLSNVDASADTATTGYVLAWNGSTWIPTALAAATGDDWGAQVVVSDGTLDGTGITGTELKIHQQSATDGQALLWDGATWTPADVEVTFGRTVATISGSWLFAYSIAAYTPPFDTTEISRVSRIQDTADYAEVLLDIVVYEEYGELTVTAGVATQRIGTIPVGYRPQTEVTVAVPTTFDASVYEDSDGGTAFVGTQTFMNASVTILTTGAVYLHLRESTGGQDVKATLSAVDMIIIPIFVRYLTLIA